MSRVSRRGRLGGLLLALCVASVAGMLTFAGVVHGQQPPLLICGGEGSGEPEPIPTPTADGWTNDQAALQAATDVRRYQFTVEKPGTAYVYVGDQWYNLDLGVFSTKTKSESCWRVEARGTSQESDRRVLQFVRPDERAIKVEPGDYILTIRAGDGVGFDASKMFTVRVAVGPTACALFPDNEKVEGYPDMTKKPDNPDKFQLGVSFEPDVAELGPFSLMSFNATVSPPYTDLFDFAWEIDGQPVAGVTEATFLRPFADLPQTPDGTHTIKMTAKGAREYKDPTEARFNFTPFDGGSRTVTCTFRAPQ